MPLFFKKILPRTVLVVLIGYVLWLAQPASAVSIPDPESGAALSANEDIRTLVLAGGCFWGIEAVFEHVKGVKNVVSGYAGGAKETANYEAVSSGTTGHAEAVQIIYDASVVSLGTLLKVYFSIAHDPTQLNFQGPDHGTQYRSAIFFAAPEEKQVAESYIAQLREAKSFPEPIVTTLEPLNRFYAAENYHQDFAAKNPRHPYIMVHDAPKVKNLEREFPALYR